jgi:pSer/pThr/pTyr-binding forkhead associated (FHA) protein
MVLVEEMVSRSTRRRAREGKIHINPSTNGTFVNGERIVKGWLKEGDRVLIGSNT